MDDETIKHMIEAQWDCIVSLRKRFEDLEKRLAAIEPLAYEAAMREP